MQKIRLIMTTNTSLRTISKCRTPIITALVMMKNNDVAQLRVAALQEDQTVKLICSSLSFFFSFAFLLSGDNLRQQNNKLKIIPTQDQILGISAKPAISKELCFQETNRARSMFTLINIY